VFRCVYQHRLICTSDHDLNDVRLISTAQQAPHFGGGGRGGISHAQELRLLVRVRRRRVRGGRRRLRAQQSTTIRRREEGSRSFRLLGAVGVGP
jgi:hypothetical protein